MPELTVGWAKGVPVPINKELRFDGHALLCPSYASLHEGSSYARV